MTAAATSKSAACPPFVKPGGHVLLRAEMDCYVAMSACPQDIVPINGQACSPVELHFEVRSAPRSARPMSSPIAIAP